MSASEKVKVEEEKRSETREILVALAGNPNVGKTTIFNALTGSHQHVGNWPGVTVEKKEGYFVHKGTRVKVVDLPGIYGLTAYSIDERIARDFLINDKPNVVVAILDATNIERNLLLILELMEMELNMVIDLNLVDEARKIGMEIDTEGLSKFLGVPVVETVAVKKQGIEDLKDTILKATENKSNAIIKYPRDFEEYVEFIENELQGYNFEYPARWLAIKLLEQDPEITEMVKTRLGEKWEKLNAELLKISSMLEKRYNDDPSVVVPQIRYRLAHDIAKKFVKKRMKEKVTLTDKLDRIFASRIFGIPIFLGLMWLTFQLTFSVGGIFADWIDAFFGWLSETSAAYLASHGVSNMIVSLVSDGIIGGVGTVLVFLPNIFLLFLAISFMEDIGYMARVVFIMDRIMNAIGLHGKSFIPMMLGFGCNVPAIMATRTIESEADRKVTILVNPLMSCSARLPIYMLFTSLFFQKNQGLVILSIYLIGIALAIILAKLFKTLFFKDETTPLVMEIPPYRIPSAKNVFGEATRRSAIFLKKAGTIIFAATLIIWVLASFPSGVEYGGENSIAGIIGKAIAPILKPAGFGFWQAGVALLFGTLAKETVVGTLGTLFGGNLDALKNLFTPLSAYSFMIFSLIYIPCIATIGVIKREIGWKWALFTLIYLPILAYVVSVLVYQIGRAFI
jgi:ferrous iron transport protein B